MEQKRSKVRDKRLRLIIGVAQAVTVFIGTLILVGYPPDYSGEYFEHVRTCDGLIQYSYSDYVFMRENPERALSLQPYLTENILGGFACCTIEATNITITDCRDLWYNRYKENDIL